MSGALPSAGWPGPNSRYMSVFHGEYSASPLTSMSPTHLIDEIPTQSGTTRRTGPPWSGGSGRPFIS